MGLKSALVIVGMSPTDAPMEVDLVSPLPGGHNFYDISTVFTDAAKDIEHGELIFAEGFSLQDAMSAFEIGEPRLDSGFIFEEESKPSFNPLVPLLPQEICWILDRSFTCEMEWHAGNTMSQTVFTLLFVHHLDDIDPDLVADGPQDPLRPLELITLVLRAAVFGLLKCCDLSWRELMQGGMYDGEDWQGDKCDVSLLEGQPVKSVLTMLDDAVAWLSNVPEIPTSLLDSLITRILLRRTILELMDLRAHKNNTKFRALITTARGLLEAIRTGPPLELANDSPAKLCFDPLVARKLSTVVPFRSLPLRELCGTWDAMGTWFDSWDKLAVLSIASRVSNWTVAGNLRGWLPGPPQTPYIRSSIQRAFSDGSTILNNHSLMWIVDRFFMETMGTPYETLVETISDLWVGEISPDFDDLEQQIIEVMTSHVKILWCNPPRRRRHLMKSLFNWHALYDTFLKITSSLDTINDPAAAIVLQRLPAVALFWRFSIIRDVVLSGFQLELYSTEEKCFAYWYAARVMKAHLASVNELLMVVEEDSEAYTELRFQSDFLSVLRMMSTAMFSVTLPIPLRGQQSKSNFLRRYKWAFRPMYIDIETPAVAPPVWEQFLDARIERSNDELYSPCESVKLARTALMQLMESPLEWAGPWGDELVRFLRILTETCEHLYALPASMKDVRTFDVSHLKWDPQKNPWFPVGCENLEGD